MGEVSVSKGATIIDFLSTSLAARKKQASRALTPNEQLVADQLAACLDHKLAEIVRELEKVASCQQEPGTGAALGSNPAFSAFCAGLHQIGQSLLPHLIGSYADFIQERALDDTSFVWIVRARSDAFINYLIELARVHGVAFDITLHHIGAREVQILSQLEQELRQVADRAITAC